MQNMKNNFQNLKDEELFYFLASPDKKKSREAFDILYSRHSTHIYSYCRKILVDSEAIEDIFQETFVKAFESAKNGVEMTNFGGFLLRIARNLCINELRDKKRNKTESFVEGVFQNPVNQYEQSDATEIVNKAMAKLPFNYREVLVLREIHGMSYVEIAKVLKKDISNIRVRIYRGKIALKQILQPLIREMNKLDKDE